MSVVWARRAIGRWAGRDNISTNSYRREWIVLTDDIDDGPEIVLAAADLPALYDAYTDGNDEDDGTVVTNRLPRRDPNAPLLWHVDLTYTVLVDDSGAGGAVDITTILPGIRMWFINYTRPTQKDRNGDPIDNSAGQLFNPAVQMDDCRLAIEITRNELTAPFERAQLYQNALNSDWAWDVGPEKLKIANIGGIRKALKEQLYYEVKYEIHYRKDGWAATLLDQGFFRKAAADGGQPSPSDPAVGIARILDERGIPSTVEVKLDGQGQELVEGANPVFLSFDLYPLLPYAPLQLPAINL